MLPFRAALPEFGTAEADRSRRITVRSLLNQTSGIGNAGLPAGDEPDTVEQRARSLRTARLVSDPEREFHYSDSNNQILPRLVESSPGAVRFVPARARVRPVGHGRHRRRENTCRSAASARIGTCSASPSPDPNLTGWSPDRAG
jgi:hypothetical protein